MVGWWLVGGGQLEKKVEELELRVLGCFGHWWRCWRLGEGEEEEGEDGEGGKGEAASVTARRAS